MITQTKIEWTDYTVNFWEGCQKVGPGCDNCYAEARDQRFTGGTHWGPGAPRRKVKGGIAKLRMINRTATEFKELNSHWPRVFCSSLMDFFDNAVDPEWRDEAMREIGVSTGVRFQLLTKRIGNVESMVRDNWKTLAWPQHVGLMITVVNQAEASRDIPKLLDLKSRLGIPWVGLSMEPLLGAVDIRPYIGGRTYECGCGWRLTESHLGLTGYVPNKSQGRARCYSCGQDAVIRGSVDWVIIGGESGPNARPMHPDWARQILAQCEAAGTPVLFKQWGEWLPGECNRGQFGPTPMNAYRRCDNHEFEWPSSTRGVGVNLTGDGKEQSDFQAYKVGKKAAGRLIDGRTWDGFPKELT